MAKGAGQAKNRQCHWISLLKMQAGGGRLKKGCAARKAQKQLKGGIIA